MEHLPNYLCYGDYHLYQRIDATKPLYTLNTGLIHLGNIKTYSELIQAGYKHASLEEALSILKNYE